jgi:predicted negative regulator of RcsB-dependent stress response
MEQLKKDLQRTHVDIETAIVRLDDLVQVLAVERWWRRVFVAVIAVGLLAVGAWFSYDRQAECDRSVRARGAAIDSVVVAFETTWDQVVQDPDPVAKAQLLDAVRADQERIRPKRDCAWPV